MEATDGRLGIWIPLPQDGSVVTSHSCSECECVEHSVLLPGHCPNCNAVMITPTAADEIAIGLLVDKVRPHIRYRARA